MLVDRTKSHWGQRLVCDAAADALEHIGTDESLATVNEWRKQQDTSQ